MDLLYTRSKALWEALCEKSLEIYMGMIPLMMDRNASLLLLRPYKCITDLGYSMLIGSPAGDYHAAFSPGHSW